MKIAILSGKGGAGKTFLSTNLAALSKQSLYVDCDVEAPNGHLFLKPDRQSEEIVNVKVPVWLKDQCTNCNTCVDFCRYGAIVKINDSIHVVEEVCHHCGGCMTLCPANAFEIKDNRIGIIEEGRSDNISVLSGILDTGIASGVPIIDRLIEKTNTPKYAQNDIWIDCPPGSACTVMASIKTADFCILVAEPTRYGLHNLEMIVELVKLYHKPFGIVINRHRSSDRILNDYCSMNGIEVLGTIPFEVKIGKIVNAGKLLVNEAPNYKYYFFNILKNVEERIKEEADNAKIADTER